MVTVIIPHLLVQPPRRPFRVLILFDFQEQSESTFQLRRMCFPNRHIVIYGQGTISIQGPSQQSPSTTTLSNRGLKHMVLRLHFSVLSKDDVEIRYTVEWTDRLWGDTGLIRRRFYLE